MRITINAWDETARRETTDQMEIVKPGEIGLSHDSCLTLLEQMVQLVGRADTRFVTVEIDKGD